MAGALQVLPQFSRLHCSAALGIPSPQVDFRTGGKERNGSKYLIAALVSSCVRCVRMDCPAFIGPKLLFSHLQVGSGAPRLLSRCLHVLSTE